MSYLENNWFLVHLSSNPNEILISALLLWNVFVVFSFSREEICFALLCLYDCKKHNFFTVLISGTELRLRNWKLWVFTLNNLHIFSDLRHYWRFIYSFYIKKEYFCLPHTWCWAHTSHQSSPCSSFSLLVRAKIPQARGRKSVTDAGRAVRWNHLNTITKEQSRQGNDHREADLASRAFRLVFSGSWKGSDKNFENNPSIFSFILFNITRDSKSRQHLRRGFGTQFNLLRLLTELTSLDGKLRSLSTVLVFFFFVIFLIRRWASESTLN